MKHGSLPIVEGKAVAILTCYNMKVYHAKYFCNVLGVVYTHLHVNMYLV